MVKFARRVFLVATKLLRIEIDRATNVLYLIPNTPQPQNKALVSSGR